MVCCELQLAVIASGSEAIHAGAVRGGAMDCFVASLLAMTEAGRFQIVATCSGGSSLSLGAQSGTSQKGGLRTLIVSHNDFVVPLQIVQP
jgi:hypothetical protein